MNDRKENRAWCWIAGHRWLAAGVILYGVCLGYVLSAVGFGEEGKVRQYIAQVSGQALHEPMPELPKMRAFRWPEIAMQRDPFQSATRQATQSSRKPTDAAQPPGEEEKHLAGKAAALIAALAATGNNYPAPAVFVKRWNLLSQELPEAQIATFTSRGQENDQRPIADLAAFNFDSAGSTSLRLGTSNVSINYVTLRETPINIGEKGRLGSYSITIKGHPKLYGHMEYFAQYCIWAIRSTRSSFTVRSAVRLFGDAARKTPPSNAAIQQSQAEAEGIRLTLTKNGENSTCEVEEADNK
jgi:hypothetical protein